MALAWKAGWVNALRGSNPLSSAHSLAVAFRVTVISPERSNVGWQPTLGSWPRAEYAAVGEDVYLG